MDRVQDATGADREAGRLPVRRRHDVGVGHRVTARTVDELEAAIGPEQEADTDVRPGRTAVVVVHRVDGPELVDRATGRPLAVLTAHEGEPCLELLNRGGGVVLALVVDEDSGGLVRVNDTAGERIAQLPTPNRGHWEAFGARRGKGIEAREMEAREMAERWSQLDDEMRALILAVVERLTRGDVAA